MQDNFTDLLKKTDMTKTQLANELGISNRQISKWKDEPPQYAVAYLKLKLENIKLMNIIKQL